MHSFQLHLPCLRFSCVFFLPLLHLLPRVLQVSSLSSLRIHYLFCISRHSLLPPFCCHPSDSVIFFLSSYFLFLYLLLPSPPFQFSIPLICIYIYLFLLYILFVLLFLVFLFPLHFLPLQLFPILSRSLYIFLFL